MNSHVHPNELDDDKETGDNMKRYDTLESVQNTSEQNVKDFKTIKWLHFSAFLFFLVQFIVYVTVPNHVTVGPTISVPSGGEGPIRGNYLKNLGGTSPVFLIPLFVILASVDHLLCFLICQFAKETATYWLFTVGSNPLRMIEYSISASIMAVAISILSGVTDVHIWFLIFIMHSVGMGFGVLIELLPKVDSSDFPIKFSTIKTLAFWLGSVSIFTPWLVICCYFFRSVNHNVPDFVYAAFFITLVLFITFGVNSYLHHILGLYEFPVAEIVYISLSFTAKTFLAGDVFGGLVAANK